MMKRLLRDDYTGKGANKRIAQAINAIGRLLNNLRGLDNILITPNNKGGLDIAYSNPGGGNSILPTPEYAYVAGKKIWLGPGAKRWIRCNRVNLTAEWHDGPPPDPFPPDEEWYEVGSTDPHIW